MAKKKDWVKILAGGALLLFGTLTPIPDDIVTAPLGLYLIADGLG